MQIEHSVLENGLNVITARLPGFDSAAVAAVVNAGARHETEANNGIAHFLEHMAFKGTTTRTAAQIAEEIELYGSSINAFTSQSMTAYHVNGLKKNVSRAVDILGDVLTRSVLAESDIEIERGVILQEVKLYEDNPQVVAGWAFSRTAYPDQPAGRPILGTPDIIRGMQRSNFVDFVGRHYTAPNMAVIGAGDLEHAAFVDLVRERFAALPKNGTRSRPVQARWVGGYNGDASRIFEQVNIFLGLPSLPSLDPGYYAHRMMAMGLGQGMSSPLFREIREKRGLVYATAAFSDHQPDHGDFAIYGGMTPEHVEEFLRVACDLLVRPEEVIGEQDVMRARNALLSNLATEKERPFQLALHLARHLFDTGVLLDPDLERQRIEAVTLEDVHAAARAIVRGVPTLAMVGPIPQGRDHYAAVCTALGAPMAVAA